MWSASWNLSRRNRLCSAAAYDLPMRSDEVVPRSACRQGLSAEDAPILYADVAEFYRALSGELDLWGRAAFTREELRDLARARRQFLHELLDRALDVVELTAEVEEGWPWP